MVKIISITKENRKLFNPILPKNIQEELEASGRYALEAVFEDGYIDMRQV